MSSRNINGFTYSASIVAIGDSRRINHVHRRTLEFVPSSENDGASVRPDSRVESVRMHVHGDTVVQIFHRYANTVLRPIAGGLGSCSLSDLSGVRDQSRNCHADMLINVEDPLVRARLIELGSDELLDSENNTVLASQTDDCPENSYATRSDTETTARLTSDIGESYPLFSTAFCAYSTWKTRPSGENCDAERSYWKTKRLKSGSRLIDQNRSENTGIICKKLAYSGPDGAHLCEFRSKK